MYFVPNSPNFIAQKIIAEKFWKSAESCSIFINLYSKIYKSFYPKMRVSIPTLSFIFC